MTVGLSGSSVFDQAEKSPGVVPFAIPANDRVAEHWTVERDAFADKLHRALRIPASTATEFSGWILEAAERHELSADLVASLVLTESTFRKDVRSSYGAYGPAQVRIDYWQKFCGSANLRDPEENIYCGAQILAHYQDVCGSESCALRSYNVGFHNRNNRYFTKAGNRYVGKIERYRKSLRNTAI